MAKMGGPAPSAPMSSPRPMANPALMGSMMGSSPRPVANPRLNPAAPAAPGGGGGGLFPNMPIQQRYDMAMELLKNGMAMGANSGSPLAAFLAPLAGAAIGGAIENKRAKEVGAQNDSLMSAMIPGGLPPEVQKLAEVVDDPNAPGYMKTIAKARLDEALKAYMPGAGGGGGGGGSKGGTSRKGGGSGKGKGNAGSGGKSKGGEALFDSYVGADGIIRGRTRDGRMLPYVDENGKPMRSGAAAAATETETPTATSEPVVIDGYTIEEIQ